MEMKQFCMLNNNLRYKAVETVYTHFIYMCSYNFCSLSIKLLSNTHMRLPSCCSPFIFTFSKVANQRRSFRIRTNKLCRKKNVDKNVRHVCKTNDDLRINNLSRSRLRRSSQGARKTKIFCLRIGGVFSL
jgi:hypothetical protein